MRGIVEVPQGLRYIPELLSPAQEGELLTRLAAIDYAEVRMHGQVARRVVRHYGVNYAYDPAQITPGDPLPDWLSSIRVQCAELLGALPERLAECLLTRYPPGSTIGWHRDAPMFGDVVGVSLRSTCVMRFQTGRGAERRVYERLLEPRSAYVLTGTVRNAWQHSIPAVSEERYSITFRTLRTRSRRD
jgi:DNA oxidative demethylase